VEEDEVLMEVHPYAAISHLSALVFHNLTDVLPAKLTISVPATGTAGLLPTGTTDEDWVGTALVRGQQTARVLNRPVRWINLSAKRHFGIRDYQPRGYPVRVTTPERTLLDCLQQPELGGGFENVLLAWVAARDILDLEALVHYVEVFDVGVLRQRVGLILEELGLHHEVLRAWQNGARRGGSSRLLASAPYAPSYSERWNLSVNASIDALHRGSS
jgi:predicted transcriptional regulator of viral defense system